MALRKRLKKGLRRFTNVRAWSDYDRTKENTQGIIEQFKSIFLPKESRYKETFDGAVSRFHMTEKDITSKRRQFLTLAVVQLLLMGGLFAYGVYMFQEGSWHSALASIGMGLVMLTLAFRNHFWYFQIKKRKLGCSVREYFLEGLLGVKL